MYSDWESSLTELSSDEDEYIPNASKKKKAPPRKTKGEYKASGSHALVMPAVIDPTCVFHAYVGRECPQTVPHNDVYREEPVRYVASGEQGATPKRQVPTAWPPADQIIDNTIHLDPEYQRGGRCRAWTMLYVRS